MAHSSSNIEATSSSNTGMPADFLDFYERFHADPEFQLAHVSFPLQGVKATDEDGGVEAHNYTKDEWVTHKPYDDLDGTFRRSFSEFGGMVTETIQANQSESFRMLRRFAKLGDEWHLIYYEPMGMYMFEESK